MFAFWVVSSRSRHNSLGICQCGRANYLSSKAKIDQKTGNVSFEDADENLDVDTWKHHGGYHDDPPPWQDKMPPYNTAYILQLHFLQMVGFH